MHELRICPETGDLLFPAVGARVARLSKWKHFPEELKAIVGPDHDMRTGWIWRSLSPLTFAGHPVGMMLGYHAKRLEMLYFSLLEGEPWPAAEEAEKEVVILRQGLQVQLGVAVGARDVKFPWGGAYCSYDPRSGFASAGLNYGFR